jgi:protein-L-isoaspartate(D-aspartate) O-methyltransferase
MTTMEAGRVADLAAAISPARRAMIDSQLRTSGVNEPWVLAAMAALPREDYVPEPSRAAAYTDRAVPLGGGRYLAAPLFYGRMLSEAAPTAADRALVVSGGSDYLADLIRPLVGTLETIPADGAAGLGRGGPFSLILIDGAVEQLPPALITALADGGRIVAGLVERGLTRLAVGRKAADAVAWLPLAEMGIPALPEFSAPRRWSF